MIRRTALAVRFDGEKHGCRAADAFAATRRHGYLIVHAIH
jgi:hypothetical protein